LVWSRPEWHSRAACRGKADLFYLERGRRPRTGPPTLRCGSGTVGVLRLAQANRTVSGPVSAPAAGDGPHDGGLREGWPQERGLPRAAGGRPGRAVRAGSAPLALTRADGRVTVTRCHGLSGPQRGRGCPRVPARAPRNGSVAVEPYTFEIASGSRTSTHRVRCAPWRFLAQGPTGRVRMPAGPVAFIGKAAGLECVTDRSEHGNAPGDVPFA
jgi:hypothetical protein